MNKSSITIVASGSRGDVQPYLPRGQGLKQAGHRVRVLTSETFADIVTRAGLEFESMGFDIEQKLDSDEWRKTIESGNFLTILAQMQAEMKAQAAELAPKWPGWLRGSDLIVTGMPAYIGVLTVAGHLGIPVVRAHLFPFAPTAEFSSPLVPKLPFGQVLNPLSFHVTRQLFWQSQKISDQMIRRALGLGPGSFWGPFKALARDPNPVLYGHSRHVLPQPKDWPASYQVTGYWFLDVDADWAPPPDLVQFLEADEPPVYIGFGSMGSRNPRESGEIALAALRRSGQRGIIASGWGGLTASDLPDSVHLIKAIPHSWLFPKLKAVVHHGGAGTTAAGLRAGAPSIVVPVMGDQGFWGQRVADLGVGPAPIPRRQLTAARLAEAITHAVSDDALRQRASDLGARIRSEDGVGNAVRVIEGFVRST